MSTSAISSMSSPLQNLLIKPKQDLQSLQSDLNSGSLAAAQQDFAAFQQDALGLFQGANGPQVDSQKDLQTLQDALSSGDLAGAQKAFAAFQNDLGHNVAGHKRHHHHHQNMVNAYQ